MKMTKILLGCALCIALAGAAGAQVPSEWDWRDVDGRNYLLPVKNIGACGSQYISIPVSMVESRRLVAWRNIGINARPLAYSVQYLLSCADGYYGDFGCSGGYAKDSLTWIRDVGIPLDFCYEYRAVDQPCPSICPDSGTPLNLVRLVKDIGESSNFLDVQTMKDLIWQGGPIAVSLDIYQDIYTLEPGAIYEHLTGSYLGGQAVLIVGWGNTDGVDYWICQNCWGANWCDEGYFLVRMNAAHANCNFGEWVWWCSIATGITPVPETVPAALLLSNAPNPFNPRTTIRYTVTQEGRAVLKVHDVSGRLIRTLVDAPRTGGVEYTTDWDGRDDRGRAVTSGVYFCRLNCAGESATARMLLLR